MADIKVKLRRKISTGFTGLFPKVKIEGIADKQAAASTLLSAATPAENRYIYMTPSGFKLGTATETLADFNIAPADHAGTLHNDNYLDDISAELWQPDKDFFHNEVVTYLGYAFKCALAPGMGTWTQGNTASEPDGYTPGSNSYWTYLGVTTMTVETMVNNKVDLDGSGKILFSQLDLSSGGSMKYLGSANLTSSTNSTPIMLSTLFATHFGTLTDQELTEARGGYLIVTAPGWVNGSSAASAHDYIWREELDDDQDAGDLGLHLEVGDWIIFTGYVADGGDSGYNDIYFATMNNSYRIASTTHQGLAQLSTGVTTRQGLATVSNSAKVIDEKALRDIMHDMPVVVEIPVNTTTKVLSKYEPTFAALDTGGDNDGKLALVGPTGVPVDGMYPYSIFDGISPGWDPTTGIYDDFAMPINHLETDWIIYDSFNNTYFTPSTEGTSGTFASVIDPLDDDLLIVFETVVLE